VLEAVFLVEDPDSASARTRGHDLVPGLARQGIAARVEGLTRGTVARRKQIAALGGAGVVVLARKLLAGGDLARLRRAARALVFDIDDAVSERPWDARKRGRSWTRPRRFADALRAADLVVAGSAALRDLAIRGGHGRVRLLPVAVLLPPRVTLVRSRGDGLTGESVRLLWSGSRPTLGYLEALRAPLEALARRRPRVELLVIADAPPRLGALPVTFERWSAASEERALLRADLGLMPLAEDPWSRGKCGLKLARYLAFGVPAVSSRFGAGAEIVDAPHTGLLADDPGEWLFALEALVGDPDRRKLMAGRARSDAAVRFSLDARTQAWAAVLREAGAMAGSRGPSSRTNL
jgi:hypothetical protein